MAETKPTQLVAGEVLLVAACSCPSTGNMLTIGPDGDCVIRLEINPGDIAQVTEALRSLRARLFYVALVSKQLAERDDGDTQAAGTRGRAADPPKRPGKGRPSRPH